MLEWVRVKQLQVTVLAVSLPAPKSPLSHLDVVLGVGLEGVDQVWELDTITDEEHWHVVAHQVPVALTSVELDSKATGVTQGLWTGALVNLRDGRAMRISSSPQTQATAESSCFTNDHTQYTDGQGTAWSGRLHSW
jgi:hypothetical protein